MLRVHLEVEARIAVVDQPQHRRQQIRRDGRDDAEPQHPGERRPQRLRLLHERADLREHGLGAGGVLLPGRGEQHPARRTLHERHAERLLQRRQRPGQRRLAHAQGRGGVRRKCRCSATAANARSWARLGRLCSVTDSRLGQGSDQPDRSVAISLIDASSAPTSTRSNPWETPAIGVFLRCKESVARLSGGKFPEFDKLTACVSLEKGKEFETIDHKTYEGKWKVVFDVAQGLHLRVPDRDRRLRQAERRVRRPRRPDPRLLR
ncbi:hypothetical protein SALBM217S_08036 [Streptomyces griseoloalbus]